MRENWMWRPETGLLSASFLSENKTIHLEDSSYKSKDKVFAEQR